MVTHAIDSIISIPPPFNMIVMIVLIGSIGGVFTSLITQIRKYASHRQELEFKRELLDRGMTAAEIVQVIQSKTPRGDA
jgi:hypothetical protein